MADNEPISNVFLFAGPCDGMNILAHDKTTTFKVNYSIQIQDGESFVSAVHKPGQERQSTVYIESLQWSKHLDRRVAVPVLFTGMPPREKAAA